MVSRQTLSEQAVRNRDSLVAILRAPGDNTALVAQRARRLLQWKPNGTERDAWLREVLPKDWHVDETVKALSAVNGGAAVSEATAQSGAAQPAEPRGRHPQRRRRRTR